jgi:hypothetical protein
VSVILTRQFVEATLGIVQAKLPEDAVVLAVTKVQAVPLFVEYSIFKFVIPRDVQVML